MTLSELREMLIATANNISQMEKWGADINNIDVYTANDQQLPQDLDIMVALKTDPNACMFTVTSTPIKISTKAVD